MSFLRGQAFTLVLALSGASAIANDDDVLRASLAGDANKVMNEMVNDGEVYDAPEVRSYLQEIVDELSGRPGEYPVLLGQSDEVFASGLANKTIIVTAAIIARLETEAQIAMVLAHELAHVRREHLLALRKEAIARQQRRSGGSFGSLLSRAGDIANASSSISSITGGDVGMVTEGVGTANTVNAAIESIQSSMASAGPNGLGEKLEDDADEYGMRYLKEAGYDLRNAASAWERLAKFSYTVPDKYYYGNAEALTDRARNTQKLARKKRKSGGKGADPKSYCDSIFDTARFVARWDLDNSRYEAAAHTIGCALLAQPEDPRSRYLNGILLRETAKQQLEYRVAVNEFLFVLDKIPNQGSAHREIGYTYRELEDWDAAMSHLTQYLELRPKAQDASKVRKIVKEIQAEKNRTVADEEW